MMMLPMLGGSLPLPGAGLMGGSMSSLERLEALPKLLSDPAVTSAKVVMTPDKLGLAEARELYKWLSVYGVTVDELLVNQLLPDGVQDPFFAGQKAREAAVLAEARADFGPLPVTAIPRQADELAGLPALDAFGAGIWPAGDPMAARTDDRAIRITSADGEVQVAIKLPFVPREAVDLAKFENELYITIGQHRRILLLPAETAGMQPVKAKFSEGKLLVTLAGT
jgi:arsenite-transporting ATPase